MKTYLVVTNDKYKLPIAEAYTQSEIARRFKLCASAVNEGRAICNRKFRIIVLEE